MEIPIDQLLAMWDEYQLDTFSIMMDTGAVKTAQVFQVTDAAGIAVQTKATKEYLAELATKNTSAFVTFNEKLLAALKAAFPESYYGHYGCKPAQALIPIVEALDVINQHSGFARELITLNEFSDGVKDYLVADTPLTVERLKAIVRSVDREVLVEYKLNTHGLMLVCANKIEESRQKWFILKNFSTFDGIRSQITISSRDRDPLPKNEARALVTAYQSAAPQVVVFVGSVSEYAEKELLVFDPYMKKIRTNDELVTDSGAKSAFESTLRELYRQTYESEATAILERDEIALGEKGALTTCLRALIADYSHQRYIDLCYELLTKYGRQNTDTFRAQYDRVCEKSEWQDGRF